MCPLLRWTADWCRQEYDRTQHQGPETTLPVRRERHRLSHDHDPDDWPIGAGLHLLRVFEQLSHSRRVDGSAAPPVQQVGVHLHRPVDLLQRAPLVGDVALVRLAGAEDHRRDGPRPRTATG